MSRIPKTATEELADRLRAADALRAAMRGSTTGDLIRQAAEGRIGSLTDTAAALARGSLTSSAVDQARSLADGGLASTYRALSIGGYASPLREALDAIGGARSASAASQSAATAAVAHYRSPPTDAAAPPRRAPERVDDVAAIGARVRAARKAMGMTQQRFADLAGVGRRFVVELEAGKPSLEIGRVLAVCKAAGIVLTFGA